MGVLAELFNLEWIVLVTICMIAHLNGMCVFGFCNDPTMMAFEPTIASAVYTFAISWLIADYPLYPKSLKRPHRIVVFLFEVMMALMVTNVLLMFFWIPLLRMIASLLSMDANSMIGKLLCLSSLNEIFELETLLEILTTIVALALLGVVIYITETVQLIKSVIERYTAKPPVEPEDPCRPKPPTPRVKRCRSRSGSRIVLPQPPCDVDSDRDSEG